MKDEILLETTFVLFQNFIAPMFHMRCKKTSFDWLDFFKVKFESPAACCDGKILACCLSEPAGLPAGVS